MCRNRLTTIRHVLSTKVIYIYLFTLTQHISSDYETHLLFCVYIFTIVNVICVEMERCLRWYSSVAFPIIRLMAVAVTIAFSE